MAMAMVAISSAQTSRAIAQCTDCELGIMYSRLLP